MLHTLKKYRDYFSNIFYPHTCEGCGTDIISNNQFLCGKCLHQLPDTHFFTAPGNPVEKLFYGRIPVQYAAARFYFTKDSLVQYLLVQLKYKNNPEAGKFLGRMTGYALSKSGRFDSVDILVPLPLNSKKEFQRGYNQAVLICEGIQEVWNRPVCRNAVTRVRFTQTQTRQGRIDRWQNMEGVFEVEQPQELENRHVLLIDDVITTGATIEACGLALLSVPGVRLSIVATAYTV